jgi:diguanylate cyclase (GGDEF)-like protein/PAS domain S-box-containing protein
MTEPSDFTKASPEKLGEDILALERARERERQLRIETEGLLKGLEAITKSENTEQIFSNLIKVLHEFVPFEHAFMLALNGEELAPVYSTTPVFLTTRWKTGKIFNRVLSGKIASLFDVRQSEDWIPQPEEVFSLAGSALLTPLHTEVRKAVLVFVHSERAFFDKRHVRLLERFASLTQIFAERAVAELERQVADARIREQASLLDKAHDAIIAYSIDYQIRFWNKGAERLYGWTSSEVLGRSLKDLLYDDPADLQRVTDELLKHGELIEEIAEKRKDGQALIVEGHWTLVFDENNQPQSVLSIKTDISRRKAAEQEIQRLAFYDPLTKLPNRQLLMDRLQHAIVRHHRNRREGALLFIDLDNFKALNDTLGHDVGDLLLQQVAARLTTCVRESDTVARLGGDEFVVLLEGLSDNVAEATQQAGSVSEKILARLNQPYDFSGYVHYSTPSVGVTLLKGHEDNPREVLKRADLAMYQAKAAGRNSVAFFNPGMQAVATSRVEMEADLRESLQQNHFVLYYQPQVGHGDSLTGVEALIRWQHPKRGLVSPAEFIPLAEETGLISPLGQWVLKTACKQLAVWATRPETEHLEIAVNVSARQFRSPDFVEHVLNALEQTSANPYRLKLELTESLLVHNMEDTIVKMASLKEKGVGFSLDDFGTGYSSLAYLKQLPLDLLKIDRSFVRDVLTDPNDAAIARTIIALAQSLGLSVVAEGVETEAQREFLARYGCHSYQGFLFSRPLPPDQLESFISDKAMCAKH